MTKRRTGTKEWSDESLNIQCGCEHCCRYCYACANALRLGWIKNREQWKTPRFFKTWKKPFKAGRVMYPTLHDITESNVEPTIFILKPWLELGNEILIVSKPHIQVIKRLCSELEQYKNQIQFRFSIGSADQKILDFWEHDAPSFNERISCLKYTFDNNWKNSVSGEPFLDNAFDMVVSAAKPVTNGPIWIGKMNDIPHRVYTKDWTENDFKFLNLVKASQTDDEIKIIYNDYEKDPQIKWKDSIKQVMGLPEEKIG